jgi:hypothetical protein
MKSFSQFIQISESFEFSQEEYEDLVERLVDEEDSIREMALYELQSLYSQEDVTNILDILFEKVGLSLTEPMLIKAKSSGIADLFPIINLISMNITMNSGNIDNKISDEDYEAFLKSNKIITSLLNLKKFYGNISFSGSKVHDLGQLEEVHGDLILSFSEIESLNGLRYVSGRVSIHQCPLVDFGNLTEIGGSLHIGPSIIENFGKIEKIGEGLFINNGASISKITSLKEVGSYATDGSPNKIKSFGSIKKMNFVTLGNEGIEDLGEVEEIDTLFIKENSTLKSLGKLKTLDTLSVNCPNLKDFGQVEEIKFLRIGALSTGLTSFNNIKIIRFLTINTYSITDMGALKHIGTIHDTPSDLEALLKLKF